ncbi:pilus assembly protein [Desulfobacula toluolica]|uniref:pilus assembly protein n=1 Tax=Desulfobacula toluolica TaxID=28223 RepID=UPI0003096D04|nr:hypothetical protein [Desulfobacula toluolica]
MVNSKLKKINTILISTTLFIILVGSFSPLNAKDTEIYQVNTKQNCYVLLDNSGSMDFGVYEQNIDYGAMFDYLFTLNDAGSQSDYIWDTIVTWNPAYFYQNHEERRKIFLWKGQIGVTIATVDGVDTAFTGDAADPNYLWYTNHLVDTHTLIDSDGNLTGEANETQRLTTDADGHILFDGQKLPLNLDIKLKEMQTLYDGSQVDIGFGGLLNAPGYYFSGYKGVVSGSLDTAEDGDQDIYFFVTGNWVNMQAMYNLHYTTNNPDPAGASKGDPAWKYESVQQAPSSWSELSHSLQYPASGQYANSLKENETIQTITHPGSTQIQVHFSAFDVDENGDYVVLYDGSGTQEIKYDNDDFPTGSGWSETINDDTIKIALASDNKDKGSGYIIDKIRVSYDGGSYLMQNRLDVAKDALLYVIDEFHGKMNWGYASFQYLGTSGNGATINSALNPNLTDDVNRAAIRNHVENESPQYGTPLGEALQDVFEEGYWTKRHALDNLLCRKNYVISVTDGFPTDDTDWNRISNANSDPHLPFTDWDGDGWTSDPYQPPITPNYYDDVGHWMYTHSWVDKTEVTDPANSYVNVTTHHIAFGANHPLLKDAAGESGGEYVVAYNKEQLVAAFYSLALLMTEAVSFTSPVVSIDAANKIQNGDDLYLGLFLPQDNQSWVGNVKKFKLGDGSTDRPYIWMLYDGNDNEAVNDDGEFLDNTGAFWADDNDSNDSDNYGSSDVKEDGVGEVLQERVEKNFNDGTSDADAYWERPIYTYSTTSTSILEVKYDTIKASDLGVADDLTRDKVINYLYGYTYDADAATHAPLAVRDWALGSIVHSRPVVIDYYDPINILLKRYIVVGANDGMLHVFDDTDPDGDGPLKASGKEVFAFVPEDILPNLYNISQNPFIDSVDGPIALYRSNKAPKYLIFGERRGGKKYWCLNVSDTNPLNWTVAWNYENSEIAQTWSEPIEASIPVSVDASTGERTFKDVLIFTGGYDTEEDNYPEPFNDLDNNGNPYKDANKTIDGSKWDKNDIAQDVNSNNSYDLYNLDKNEYGRGIFIVDIDNPNAVTNDGSGKQILPFSAIYGAADTTDTNGAVQTLSSMKFCFPASPAVVTTTFPYIYKSGGKTIEGRKSNVISAIYATDIYSNIYRVNYNFDVDPDDLTDVTNKWTVTKIFSGNPGSSSDSGEMGQGDDTDDQGRKTFYPPAISWGGACTYFDAGNYRFSNTEFSGTDKIASLYFGTGDREHPTYTMIRNRFYAIYDDSSVTGIDNQGTDSDADDTPVIVSTVPYTEDNLLNLTCDELDTGTTLSGITKSGLQEILRDDPSYTNASDDNLLENGAANEDDAKGWYIVLEDQGDSTECSHCAYSGSVADATTTSRDNHEGEKILNKVNLYAGNLYFTSYQPSIADPCNPQGNGFAYSLNYCDGSASYNLNISNDSISDNNYDVTDRYHKVTGIFGIPSDFAIVTRQGQAGAMSMMGGDIIGPKGVPGPLPGPDFTIDGPEYGLDLYYWREGNSQK